MRPQMLILIEKDFSEIIQWLLTSVFNFNLPKTVHTFKVKRPV